VVPVVTRSGGSDVTLKLPMELRSWLSRPSLRRSLIAAVVAAMASGLLIAAAPPAQVVVELQARRGLAARARRRRGLRRPDLDAPDGYADRRLRRSRPGRERLAERGAPLAGAAQPARRGSEGRAGRACGRGRRDDGAIDAHLADDLAFEDAAA